MKKDIILIGAMLFLILVISQVKGQDCLPRLIKASKDTTFIVDDSNLLLVERPTADAYVVTMTFIKRAPVVTIINDTELTYTGLWVPASGTWGSVTYSDQVGATAKYSFTGNRVEVISDLAPTHGKFSYTINSGTEKIVDLYAAIRKNGQVVIDEPVPAGFNTITIRVITGTILIDYLKIYK